MAKSIDTISAAPVAPGEHSKNAAVLYGLLTLCALSDFPALDVQLSAALLEHMEGIASTVYRTACALKEVNGG